MRKNLATRNFKITVSCQICNANITDLHGNSQHLIFIDPRFICIDSCKLLYCLQMKFKTTVRDAPVIQSPFLN
jgi:hypothetical protein